MLPPAQRRNASVRGGDWRADTGAVHEAVQLGRRSCGANRRGNEGLFKTGDREDRGARVQHVSRTVPLTVKLSGRTPASDRSRGRILFSRARGDTTERHGPLQRLLEVAPQGGTVRVRPRCRKQRGRSITLKRAPRAITKADPRLARSEPGATAIFTELAGARAPPSIEVTASRTRTSGDAERRRPQDCRVRCRRCRYGVKRSGVSDSSQSMISLSDF